MLNLIYKVKYFTIVLEIKINWSEKRIKKDKNDKLFAKCRINKAEFDEMLLELKTFEKQENLYEFWYDDFLYKLNKKQVPLKKTNLSLMI